MRFVSKLCVHKPHYSVNYDQKSKLINRLRNVIFCKNMREI